MSQSSMAGGGSLLWIIAGWLLGVAWGIVFIFLNHLQTLCELHTNAIVHPRTRQFTSISELAEFLGKVRETVSRAISSLLKKWLVYEFVNAQEIREHHRPVSQRPLFMNPEICFSGDKNKINSVLCRLFIQSYVLEKNGDLSRQLEA